MRSRVLAPVVLLAVMIAGAHAQLVILNYHDTDAAAGSPATATANFVRNAAAAIGANLTVVGVISDFRTQFDLGGWDVVIVSSWSGIAGTTDIDTTVLDRLQAFDAGGGKVIMNAWHMQIFTSHPFFTTTVPLTVSGTYTTPIPLYTWDPTHPIWTTPNPVGSPIAVGMTYGFAVDGQYASPGPGTIAVGGYVSAVPSPNNAGILIGPSGAIVNTFTPQQYDQTSMVNLLINEILFGSSQTRCILVSPVAGTTVSGTVPLTFDGTDTESDPITSTFEWSTDAGTTWNPCITAATSLVANPDAGRATPFAGIVYEWDSVADGVGMLTPTATELRIGVTDGTHTGTCTVSVTVDNVPPSPTCVLTLPPGTLTGDVAVDIDVTSANSPAIDILVEFSVDAGVTWSSASTSASSPNPNPAIGAPLGITTIVWDSRADGVALLALVPGVLVRATIDDGVAPVSGTCQASADVDNTLLCAGICGDCNLNALGPDILDALTAAQVAAGLVVPTAVQAACCDVDSSLAVTVIDALLIAQNAAGLPAMLVCP